MRVRAEVSRESLVQSCAGEKASPILSCQLEDHRVG